MALSNMEITSMGQVEIASTQVKEIKSQVWIDQVCKSQVWYSISQVRYGQTC